MTWEPTSLVGLRRMGFIRTSGATPAASACITWARPGLAAGLTAAGCTVVPGQANYLLFRLPGVADLKEKLLGREVLIRSCANYHGLGPDWYRVCVKGETENRRLLAALREVL